MIRQLIAEREEDVRLTQGRLLLLEIEGMDTREEERELGQLRAEVTALERHREQIEEYWSNIGRWQANVHTLDEADDGELLCLIAVHCRAAAASGGGGETQQHHAESGWIICRRFREFVRLHEQLRSLDASAVKPKVLKLPSLPWVRSQGRKDKWRQKTLARLQQLLTACLSHSRFADSQALFSFLCPGPEFVRTLHLGRGSGEARGPQQPSVAGMLTAPASPRVHGGRSTSTTSTSTSTSTSSFVPQGHMQHSPKPAAAAHASTTGRQDAAAQSGSRAGRERRAHRHSSAGEQRGNAGDASWRGLDLAVGGYNLPAGALSSRGDQSEQHAGDADGRRNLDSKAEPLFRLVSEVFELKGMLTWLRRQLVTFVKLTYGANINRQLQSAVSWLAHEPQLLWYLHLLHAGLFPDDYAAAAAAVEEAATATAAAREEEKAAAAAVTASNLRAAVKETSTTAKDAAAAATAVAVARTQANKGAPQQQKQKLHMAGSGTAQSSGCEERGLEHSDEDDDADNGRSLGEKGEQQSNGNNQNSNSSYSNSSSTSNSTSTSTSTSSDWREPPTVAERDALAERACELLLRNLPSAVKVLVGPTNARKGAMRLLHVLQHHQLNQHLMVCILELLLVQLFPELPRRPSLHESFVPVPFECVPVPKPPTRSTHQHQQQHSSATKPAQAHAAATA